MITVRVSELESRSIVAATELPSELISSTDCSGTSATGGNGDIIDRRPRQSKEVQLRGERRDNWGRPRFK